MPKKIVYGLQNKNFCLTNDPRNYLSEDHGKNSLIIYCVTGIYVALSQNDPGGYHDFFL